VLIIAGGAVTTFGALQMKSLRSRAWAMTACVIAVLPCLNCCLWGWPVGIWCGMVLNRDEVKRAFG
jgi:hypothetical protein